MVWAVTAKGLTKAFGDFVAVSDVKLEIQAGEIFGLLGPNGAGKSTLIRMLTGILEPTSGSGTVLGYDLTRQAETIKQNLGYMSQKFSLYEDLTVVENLQFYAGIYGIPHKKRKERIQEILALTGLESRTGESVAGLNLGAKQRLALGCALISRPRIVFLDEPTSGVSPTARRSFFNIIQNLAYEGTTVILTTHFMDEAERCDRVGFMLNGKLIAVGSPDALKAATLPGTLVELEVPNAIQRAKEFEGLPYVKDCSVHGTVLHVLLSDEAGIGFLRNTTGVVPQPIIPSLEDVFMYLVRNPEGEEGAR
ncbi:MAG: ABC transporter ATP-binding protein [Syntrophothermus sp.]|uniref:ABC transporter ATP-binding protein n=1 Tax=Syntrophothermus sp. TaxID=2736299 RepID=UPI00257B406C|nr:ABC transporter ATP-binding protein [Syntrophothermus sp.]NSW84294.1 ABC transporter ATP-binding protein [Syntrophothermus sp.]